jgi:hypothetical protein
MTLNLTPLTDATPADGGSGGGAFSASAPVGTVPASPAGTPTSPVSEPTPIDLDDNALIRIKGAKDPVKFGEHVKGLQAQMTKAAQRAAQFERQLQAEREARSRAEAAAQQRSNPAQAGGEDVFAALRALPYLKGEDAVQLVREIGEEIRQRDYVTLAALKKLNEIQGYVNELRTSSSESAHEAKLKSWLADWGYPTEAFDLAKTVYAAWEGEDLDSEFQNIFEQHWQLAEKVIDARRQAKLDSARKPRFVPGRGGDVKPSRPLDIKAEASSKQVADELFGLFGESAT